MHTIESIKIVPKVANKITANMALNALKLCRHSPGNKIKREKAIKYVIDTGKIYFPLCEKYANK